MLPFSSQSKNIEATIKSGDVQRERVEKAILLSFNNSFHGAMIGANKIPLSNSRGWPDRRSYWRTRSSLIFTPKHQHDHNPLAPLA